MSRRWLLAPAVLTFALIASSCAGSGPNDISSGTPPTGAGPLSSASSAPTPSQSPGAAAGTAITTAASDFGTMLFDANKQAIYIWESEQSSRPECYADCATAWPPVLTTGAPTASGKVDAALLGTTKRKDGSTQVTYNGHPLYFYAHEGPGEVRCHNISTHGGLWWVIQPDGNRAP